MKLINADCIEAMKAMPDNSVDSIVTDPPYELGFMGKSWDASGIAFNVEVWREALRVIKPGGHLIAFSGSRTYHRMAVAIEDAGFEIRDQIMWVYGSGFPKSHNVANGIDKKMGASNRGHAISSGSQIHPTTGEKRANGELLAKYESRTKESEGWDGWGTALKPAHEPIVLARKPLIGTVANNVLTHGTGGLNIDGSRVGTEQTTTTIKDLSQAHGNQFGKSGIEYPKLGEKLNPPGRWPANFIHDGSDEVVELFPDTKAGIAKRGNSGGNNFGSNTPKPPLEDIGYADSGSAARFFYCAKASKRDRNEGLDGFEVKRDHDGRADGGVGGDNPRNRTNNEKLNHHPTVKPTTLMQYLVRLVTPPNGIVLDPFMGSGSTGKACAYEGFDFIGIDQSAEYCEIAKARIDFVHASLEQVLFPRGFQT